jgi:Domain of unknown function (DUF4907)
MRQISRTTVGAIVILIYLFSFQACSDHSGKDQSGPDAGKKVTISVKAYSPDNHKTWGYDILINQKIYIHQEFIPALEGNQPFRSKKDALKVGRVVMLRIKNRQSPTLSAEEVRKLLDL